ncbi:MAG TPA: hypothetical protein DEQ34_13335 [Balneolaceae bacterium]|nr:hypothetical protein [Balneolaceae bacterium]|tara:strand:- start:173233 stop:173697 length:465 start_codon:yes stop_codon:yes gene_type:complete
MRRSKEDIKERQRRARQALISQSIELGVFDDRDAVKAWIHDYFGLKCPLKEVSTEYSLTEGQKKLFYHWLLHFTGRGPKPQTHRATARITRSQMWKIGKLQEQLRMDPAGLNHFIERQIGKRKLVTSLWKNEATKVITGLERLASERIFNQTQN